MAFKLKAIYSYCTWTWFWLPDILLFANIHPITSLIWLPPTLAFLTLGLYQRKDQPVEVFLASALKYYFTPHKRRWDQEGYEERVKITAPPVLEKHYTKDFSGEEAVSRLTALSRMMDSRGWASKLSTEWQNPQLATAAVSDSDRLMQPSEAAAYTTPQDLIQQYTQPVDVMDEDKSVVARQMQAKVEQAENTVKQQAIQTLQQARETANEADEPLPTPQFRSYPTMHQKVVKPQTQIDPTSQQAENNIEPAEPETTTALPTTVEPTPAPTPAHEPLIEEGENGVEISLH